MTALIISKLITLGKHDLSVNQLQVLQPDLSFEVITDLFQQSAELMGNDPLQALWLAELTWVTSRLVDHELAQIYGLWIYAATLAGAHQHEESLKVNYELIERLLPKKDWKRIAGVRCNTLASLRELGRFEEALLAADKARHECELAGEQADKHLPNLNMCVANLYLQMGQFADALHYAQVGYEQAVALRFDDVAAKLQSLSGYLSFEMDRYDEAQLFLEQALCQVQINGNKTSLSFIYMRFGILHQYLGEYQKALKNLEQARALKVELGLPSEIAYVDYLRATTYYQLNLLEEALTLSSQARQIIAGYSASATEVEAMMSEGVTLLRMKRYVLAKDILNHVQHLLEKMGRDHLLALVRIQLALISLIQGNIQEALSTAGDVMRYANSADSPSLYAQVHLLYARCALAMHDSDQADYHLQETQRLAEQHSLSEVAIQTYYLSSINNHKRNSTVAYKQLGQAVAKITAQTSNLLLDEFRISYLSDKTEIFEAYIGVTHQRVCAHISPLQQLLYALDQMCSAPMGRRQPGAETHQFPSEQAQLDALRTEWNWFQTKLDRTGFENTLRGGNSIKEEDPTTRNKLKSIEHEIAELLRRQRVRAAGDYQAVQTELDDAGLLQATLQAQLEAGEGLLQFYVANGHCHALLVRQDDIELFVELSPIESINRLLEAWRFYIQQVVPMQTNPVLQLAQLYLGKLYESLFRPIRQPLSTLHTLNIILPTQLHDLPINALYDGQHYLVETFQIAHLSSPQAMRRKRIQDKDATKQALVVGYSDNGRLPETLNESSRIRALLASSWQVSSLTETDATAENFRQSCLKANIIHLATHATFRPDNPLFSWMRFADKHVAVVDLHDMQLEGNPLIVLSACDTGQGQPKGGGVVGMGRGFLTAGASEVVLSRWMLEDEASAELMACFYQHLIEQKASVKDALQHAQKVTLHHHPHPFFWASYLYTIG
ncbi:MAG: CHAT domain-containing protein [Candidatus Promineifilaceae bacterium]